MSMRLTFSVNRACDRTGLERMMSATWHLDTSVAMAATSWMGEVPYIRPGARLCFQNAALALILASFAVFRVWSAPVTACRRPLRPNPRCNASMSQLNVHVRSTPPCRSPLVVSVSLFPALEIS